MPFANADCPVCLILLSRFRCLHSNVVYHYCFTLIDVEHRYVYWDAHSHSFSLLTLFTLIDLIDILHPLTLQQLLTCYFSSPEEATQNEVLVIQRLSTPVSRLLYWTF